MLIKLTKNISKHLLLFFILLVLSFQADLYSAETYNLEYPGNLIGAQETLPFFEKDRKIYKGSSDSILKKIVIDKELFSDFFNSHETSYKWHILKHDDGTFENTMGEKVSKEDKVPIEHTSNCVSTHQGKHNMNFCDATLNSGVLQLKIYGGLPAYASSLLIEINDNSEFFCFFEAVYPFAASDLKWSILSKELKMKATDFTKEKQLFAWLSIEFEEEATYKGETTIRRYKIEGFIKPSME